MNELSKYTGLPYDFQNYQCWHHVRRVRADYKLRTPEFDCVSPDDIDSVFEAAHGASKGLIQVSEPSNLCAVLMATVKRNKTIWHSGVYLDGMVSHCDRNAGQVRLDSLASIEKLATRVEFWR